MTWKTKSSPLENVLSFDEPWNSGGQFLDRILFDEIDTIHKKLPRAIAGVIIPDYAKRLIATFHRYHPEQAEELLEIAELCGRLADVRGYTGWQKEAYVLMGLLHDVGKLVVPLSILDKRKDVIQSRLDQESDVGILSDEDWAIVRLHPEASRALVDVRYHPPNGIKGIERINSHLIRYLIPHLTKDQKDPSDYLEEHTKNTPFTYHYSTAPVHSSERGDVRTLIGFLVSYHHNYPGKNYPYNLADAGHVSEIHSMKQKFGADFVQDALADLQIIQWAHAMATERSYRQAWSPEKVRVHATIEFSQGPQPNFVLDHGLTALVTLRSP